MGAAASVAKPAPSVTTGKWASATIVLVGFACIAYSLFNLIIFMLINYYKNN
jgi:hypothetical protein